MTSNKNNLTPVYHEVLDRTSVFTPGKRLDTQSSVNGDTLLSFDAIDLTPMPSSIKRALDI